MSEHFRRAPDADTRGGRGVLVGIALAVFACVSPLAVAAEELISEPVIAVPVQQYVTQLETRVRALEHLVGRLATRLDLVERLLELEVKERHPVLRSLEQR